MFIILCIVMVLFFSVKLSNHDKKSVIYKGIFNDFGYKYNYSASGLKYFLGNIDGRASEYTSPFYVCFAVSCKLDDQTDHLNVEVVDRCSYLEM